jgi:hypothetical protein
MTNCEQTRKVIEDYHCETANAFLDTLSPRCERLWKGNAQAWIFRGHGDATWKLQPGAARSNEAFLEFGVNGPMSHLEQPAWSTRIDGLNAILAQFRELLDRAGLAIPSASPELRRENVYSTSAEPSREAFPLMALAQHHGLPTLFLDWSRRAWVAAYFSAVQAMHLQGGPAAKVAVWALRRDNLSNGRRDNVRIYEAPGWTNPNLTAQAGLFTLLTREDDMSLEHLAVLGGVPTLRLLTMPRSEVPVLLRLLSDEGIDGSSMFPGADGVVRAMRERAFWSVVSGV